MAGKELLPQKIKDFINWQRIKLRNTPAKTERIVEGWKLSGNKSAPPHAVKQAAIKEIQNKYQVKTLVETGTFQGEMIYAQRNNFDKIYSIELSEELHKKAAKNLIKYKHVELLQGDSGEMLKLLIKKIDHSALFWLDGHYSGFETAKGDLATPIIKELETILSSPIDHYVLIDDARLFTGKDDYPEIEYLEKFVKSFNKNFSFSIEDDIIKIIPAQK